MPTTPRSVRCSAALPKTTGTWICWSTTSRPFRRMPPHRRLGVQGAVMPIRTVAYRRTCRFTAFVPCRVRWRLSIHVRMRVIAAPRKYPDELRERATRMAVEARRDHATQPGALARVGKQLGINPETLRNWVTQAEIDAGTRPGTTTDDASRLAELEREVRELRRANAILKSASAFFAAELDRPSR